MFIKKIKKLFRDVINNESATAGEQGKGVLPGSNPVLSKEAYFDEGTLKRQRLYEKWVCKEIWCLESEGIPLLLGQDPQSIMAITDSSEYRQDHDELWSHAKRCAEKDLLHVINRDCSPETWKIKPADLYRWASISRISVPEPLARLMDFVIRTVKHQPGTSSEEGENTGATGSSHAYTETFYQHREYVLGAALAILARFPERCRDKNGRIKSDVILTLMN